MTAIYQGNETETFFDQRPTHARMSDTEWEARVAEDAAWKAYDDATEVYLAIDEPLRGDCETWEHAKDLAYQASRHLALILHAKHNPTETETSEYELPL